MKNMKLGTKIALGFGIILLISVAMGALAVWNMRAIKSNSSNLAADYVPEVIVANDLERYVRDTIYRVRGYDYIVGTQ